MNNIIISTEASCIIFLLIFLYGVVFEDNRKDMKKNIYCMITITVIFSLACDICFNSFLREMVGTRTYHLFMSISVILSAIQTVLFPYYILEHINHIQKTSFWYAHIVTLVNVIGTAVAFSVVIVDSLFFTKNIEYSYMFVYFLQCCITATALFYMLTFVILKRRLFGTHDAVAFVIYLVIPCIATVIECIDSRLAFSYASPAISLAIVYVLFQSKEVNQARMREEILNRVSNMDALTGLKNRRSFETFISSLDGEVNMGTMFCDLNGLKETNDHLGHAEGDRLIISFSEMLLKFFGTENSYRISGDEFVVILCDVEEEDFNKRVEEFKAVVTKNNQLSALGSAYGQENAAMELIAKAESEMYSDKEYYYYVCGKERRTR